MRAQGLSVLSQLQSRFEMNDPSEPLAHGAMILFSGALLLTLVFYRFYWFLLLIPNVRATVFQKVKERINIQKSNFETQFSSSQNIYEGEYEPVSNSENSPWANESKPKD